MEINEKLTARRNNEQTHWLEVFEASFCKDTPAAYLESIQDTERKFQVNFFSKKVCAYESVTIRVKDFGFACSFLKEDNIAKFQTCSKVDPETQKITSWSGKYKSTTIYGHIVDSSWVVDIHVNFRRLKNPSRSSYKNFYWTEFLEAYKQITDVFGPVINNAMVIGFTASACVELPEDISSNSRTNIKGCFISIWGLYDEHIFDLDYDPNTNYVVEGCNRTVKIEVQDNKFQTKNLSIQLKFTSSDIIKKEFGINVLSDLLTIASLQVAHHSFFNTLNDAHIYPLDFRDFPSDAFHNVPYLEDKYEWCDRFRDNEEGYGKCKIAYEILFKKYGKANLKNVLISLFIKKLS